MWRRKHCYCKIAGLNCFSLATRNRHTQSHCPPSSARYRIQLKVQSVKRRQCHQANWNECPNTFGRSMISSKRLTKWIWMILNLLFYDSSFYSIQVWKNRLHSKNGKINLFVFSHFIDNIKMDANQRSKIERVQEMFVKGYLQHKQLEVYFNRLLKILLKAHALHSLDADLVEELFFSKLIGMPQISNVVSHILNLGADYTSEIWTHKIIINASKAI